MQPWGSALGEVEIICMFDIMAGPGWLRYLIQPWLLRVRWLTLVLNGHDESSSLMMIIIAMEMVTMMILTMKMKRVNIGQWPGEQWPSSVSRADMRSSTREARPRKQTYLNIMMIMIIKAKKANISDNHDDHVQDDDHDYVEWKQADMWWKRCLFPKSFELRYP